MSAHTKLMNPNLGIHLVTPIFMNQFISRDPPSSINESKKIWCQEGKTGDLLCLLKPIKQTESNGLYKAEVFGVCFVSNGPREMGRNLNGTHSGSTSSRSKWFFVLVQEKRRMGWYRFIQGKFSHV